MEGTPESLAQPCLLPVGMSLSSPIGLKSIDSLSLVCLCLLQGTIPSIIPGTLPCWLDGAARLGRESVTNPVLLHRCRETGGCRTWLPWAMLRSRA